MIESGRLKLKNCKARTETACAAPPSGKINWTIEGANTNKAVPITQHIMIPYLMEILKILSMAPASLSPIKIPDIIDNVVPTPIMIGTRNW